jgi:L-threonylcarbamoyladenylate synthase
VRTERLRADNPAHLQRAAELLRNGQIVAFPTETVYGLGANALSAAAVEKIFVAKQRPHWDPLIVHVVDQGALAEIATSTVLADRLMAEFWPGPLTLLLPRLSVIPDSVTAGRPLVGVRSPAHSVARDLLRLARIPIAAPSANRFGHTSPTSAAHVLDDLDGRIAAVVDGGATEVGVESTVVETRSGKVTIYRAGAVTQEMLEGVEGVELVELYRAAGESGIVEGLPSPGVGIRHYAPRARLLLVRAQPIGMEAAWLRELAGNRVDDGPTGVMLPDGWSAGRAELSFPWGPWNDAATLARRLFAGLRALDQAGAKTILCPLPEVAGLGEALRDRLEKAAREK